MVSTSSFFYPRSLRCWILLVITVAKVLADAPIVKLIPLTSRDGKIIQVTVISVTDVAVKVKKQDGKEFEIPWDRLTPESAALAKESLPKLKPPAIPEKPRKPEDIPEKVIVKQGESIAVSFTVTDGKLHAPVILKGHPGKTPCFTVKFEKTDKGCSAVVQQSILPAVKLRCLARAKGRKDYFETSIIPPQMGKPNYELWGHDLEELVFFGLGGNRALRAVRRMDARRTSCYFSAR
jgi:hypothetical protein